MINNYAITSALKISVLNFKIINIEFALIQQILIKIVKFVKTGKIVTNAKIICFWIKIFNVFLNVRKKLAKH